MYTFVVVRYDFFFFCLFYLNTWSLNYFACFHVCSMIQLARVRAVERACSSYVLLLFRSVLPRPTRRVCVLSHKADFQKKMIHSQLTYP